MSPDARKHLSLSGAALLGVALINLGAPFLPVPNLAFAVVSGIVVTLLYVAAIIAFALGVARAQLSVPATIGLMAFFLVVWLGVNYVGLPMMVKSAQAVHAAGMRLTRLQRLSFACVSTMQTLALIGGATAAGSLISRIIRFPNMLGPIGAAIALIDIWGVLFGGIVSQLLSNKATQPIAQKAMAAAPQVGAASNGPHGFSIPIPDIGIGDFLFISLLLSVLVRLNMNWRTPAWLMWVLVSLALLSITFLPFVPFLPGLLFIGAGAVLPNLKYFSFTREEKFALLWAGIFVLGLTVALYFGFSAALPKK